MKKLLGLFICVLFSFIQISIYNSVFAGCHTEYKYDEEQGMVVDIQVCDEPEPGDQGGETPKECPGGCCGIKLNTNFPIIGNCIESKDATGAFPTMMGALAKMVVSLILVVCFILVIVAGIMWAADNPGSRKGGGAKGLLKKVAITILLLGFSGVILRLINPNFFG